MRFENCTIQIEKNRWDVRLTITDEDGTYVLVASADSYFTWGDGIWFGSLAEYEEELSR